MIKICWKERQQVKTHQIKCNCNRTHAYTQSKISSCHQVVTLTQWTNTGMPGHYSGTKSWGSKSTRGRAGGAVPCCRMMVWAPKVPHPLARHGQQFDTCFPSYTRYPLMLWRSIIIPTFAYLCVSNNLICSTVSVIDMHDFLIQF